MKLNWNITISGGCPTFTGPELIEIFFGTEKEAKKRRQRLEKETGRIMYLALSVTQKPFAF